MEGMGQKGRGSREGDGGRGEGMEGRRRGRRNVWGMGWRGEGLGKGMEERIGRPGVASLDAAVIHGTWVKRFVILFKH